MLTLPNCSYCLTPHTLLPPHSLLLANRFLMVDPQLVSPSCVYCFDAVSSIFSRCLLRPLQPIATSQLLVEKFMMDHQSSLIHQQQMEFDK
jgi:hypothetical protein